MGCTFKDAVEASEAYFGDKTTAEIFVSKYALRDKEGNYVELTPQATHQRLAKEFARVERKFGCANAVSELVIMEALEKFKRIVPQGSPMAAIGNQFALMSASNCTVIESPKDDLGDIMRVGEQMAQLMKRRAGVGVDLSHLRPVGSKVNNAATQSSGAYAFSDFYSYIARMIGQKGRQGALMITMDIMHPDSQLLATIKHDKTKVTGANISLRVPDSFMKAVEKKQTVTLQWPLDGTPVVQREVNAVDLFNTIVGSAYKTGDPGLLMWDNILKNLPAHCYEQFQTISTNPCAEIPLSAYDSCRLISINLTSYVKNPFLDTAYFDFATFQKDVELATRLSDDLVELELELVTKIRNGCENPTEKKMWHNIYEAARLGRRTGLGTHGWGDTLARLCIRYDDPEAHRAAHKVYGCLRDTAYATSVQLAQERGAFPLWNWDTEKGCEFFKRMPKELIEAMRKHGRRNVSLLTNAPTGTISMMSGTTSGIEPIFRLEYMRRVKIHGNAGLSIDFVDEVGEKWHHYNIVHPSLKEYCALQGIKLNNSKTLKEQRIEVPDFFTTSDKLDYSKNVKMIGIIQSYIDHGVSCTINMPRESTPEMVQDVYIQAWKSGLKGVTVYVDGSRSGVLIDEHGHVAPSRRKRPKDVPCDLHMTSCQGKRWLVIVGLLDGKPYEVFAGRAADLPMSRDITKALVRKMGKRQYSIVYEEDGEEVFVPIKESFLESNGMLVRLLMNQCLRHEVPIEALYDTITKASDITDFSRTVVRVLKEYMKDDSGFHPKCASCGSINMRLVDGCFRCEDCGHSKCG